LGADRFLEGGVVNLWSGTKLRGGREGDIAEECLSISTWERMAARDNLCDRVMGFLSLIEVLEARPLLNLRRETFMQVVLLAEDV